ncbi:putative calcium-transporting ATPase 13, plasma membrane-type [Diospyros lotus]|uniref:putative calcium-transporting ATPase 13, plasma membrane-type n=1 Tax=Diospyros lotus TaxID=55363 RepID=UPI002256E15A|nr:putative calcium-transporting ATPase 13, plasma membrane-type [Diospyros lotus]
MAAKHPAAAAMQSNSSGDVRGHGRRSWRRGWPVVPLARDGVGWWKKVVAVLVRPREEEQEEKKEEMEKKQASTLKTDIKYGIRGDSEDLSRRHEAFGTNKCGRPPEKSFFQFVWQTLTDFTIVILLAWAALSLGFGMKEDGPREGWYDGGSIFLAGRIPLSLRSQPRQQVSIFEIVVGDVVCLKTGDQVPADGLFIDGHSLRIGESSMTGESDHIESATIPHEQTPLQARLNQLASSIGKVGLAVAFQVLVVLLARYFTGNTEDENGNKEFDGSRTKADDVVNSVLGIIADAVTIVVVAIPEGLPLAVTLTLAHSMKRMMADQDMVRKLSACETMGSATTICTDKTGTFTLNQMKVLAWTRIC